VALFLKRWCGRTLGEAHELVIAVAQGGEWTRRSSAALAATIADAYGGAEAAAGVPGGRRRGRLDGRPPTLSAVDFWCLCAQFLVRAFATADASPADIRLQHRWANLLSDLRGYRYSGRSVGSRWSAPLLSEVWSGKCLKWSVLACAHVPRHFSSRLLSSTCIPLGGSLRNAERPAGMTRARRSGEQTDDHARRSSAWLADFSVCFAAKYILYMAFTSSDKCLSRPIVTRAHVPRQLPGPAGGTSDFWVPPASPHGHRGAGGQDD
jgi:hypothetical protein